MTDRRNDRLLRLPEVKRRTGLSRQTIYRRMTAGTFPDRVILSASIVAWYEGDINAWVENPAGWAAAA